MSSPAVLIATARVRAGKEAEFTAWKARHDTVIGKFPGYVSSDMIPGANGSNEWKIVINFRSADDLAAWRQSRERAQIVSEGIPLFEGGSFGEVAQVSEPGAQPTGDVTEVIFSRITPGMEDAYREPRERELAILQDPLLLEAVRERGIVLKSFAVVRQS